MSWKNKRITLFISIVTAALALVLLYFLTVRKSSKPAEPLKAIPTSASVIIKVNDLESLFEKTSGGNPVWNELNNIPLFARYRRQILYIDSLTRSIPEIRQIVKNPPSFISAHLTGKDKISLMHIFRIPSQLSGKKIRDMFSNLIADNGTVKTRNYEGVEIHEVSLHNKSAASDFAFAASHDILIISFSVTVLEDAIRRITGSDAVDTAVEFNKIYATAGKNVDANVFINFREFPKSLSAFVKAEYKPQVRLFGNFAGWAELDLNPLSDMLLMNGFVNPPDSAHSLASLLIQQPAHKIMSDEVLPSSVSTLLALNITDSKGYMEGYREFLREEGRLTGYINTLQAVNRKYGTNFPDDILEIADRELTLGIDGNTPEGSDPRVYILVRVRSKTQAEEKFRSVARSMAAAESLPASDYITDFRLDADMSFKIYRLPVRKLTSMIFGPVFSALDEHYFVVLDNYLVFSGSVESLKSLIHNYVLNKTLSNDPAYKEFKSSLSPRSNLYFYCNLSRSISFFSKYLTPSVSRSWHDNLDVFQRIRASGVQLYANNNMLYSNLLIRHLSSSGASAQTVWESKLDTIADFKPVFAVNHQTQQNEVFVQDLNNNIYLINHVGRILWKLRLPEPIISDVYQVDYYRNGKLQLLFSTKSSIYLIDRNGNPVDKYPVTLRSPATNGVAVFDYDRNRDYRLFIACEDRRVYAYNREGNLLSGWEFDRSESEVTQPVNHFRIGDRDFIVFGDRYKTYILDRRGSIRVNVDTYFPRSANNNYVLNLLPAGGGPSIAATDTTGKVYFIGFNGKVTTVELPGKFTNRHYFDFRDLNGDNKPEYIFLEDDRLVVYTIDRSRLFTVKFGKPVRSKPVFYQFSSSDRKLGVVSRDENLIYLVNNNGEFYNGFPLQGNTPFSIGNFGDSLSRFNLVVGSRDNFLYNYRVK